MKNSVLKFTALIVLLFSISLISARSVPKGKFVEHRIGSKGKHVKMPKFNRDSLIAEDKINESNSNKVGGVRFAEKFYVELTPDNSGELSINEDGLALWKIGLKSDSAYSINLFFSKFHLLAGDTIYIYNADKSKIVGPLTEANNLKSGKLPTVPIPGDSIIVELRQSANTSTLRSIEIGEINHDYRGLRGLPSLIGATTDSCSYHATCFDTTDKLEKAVCLLIIDGSVLCTGTLVNNTALNGRPYVLTAAHCLDGYSETPAEVATSIVAFFNYEAPNCMPSVRGSIEQTIGGATLKAFTTDIDLALVELSSTPPVDYRPYYVGWNIATSPTPPFYGIHHPYGTVKRVCVENNAITSVSAPISGILSSSHWRVARWDVGTTDEGSSGSGLFDASGKLVGALTGGSSYCPTPVNDYYYRLNKAWEYYSDSTKQLKAWLDPTASGATSLGGLNPYGTDTALRFSNIAKTEVPEKAYLESPYTGLLAGQNSLNATDYAEKYSLGENAYLYGIYVVPSIANADATRTSPNQISIQVYAGDAEPESAYLLVDTIIDITSLQWSSSNGFYTSNKAVLKANDNYIRLSQPVAVGKNFMITYDVPYTNLPTDSFAVYTAPARAEGELESSLVKVGGSWMSMYDFSGVRTSLWLDPVIQYDSTAVATDTSLVGRDKQTIVFPNPADTELRVMTRTDMSGECKLTLYNMSGRIIKQKQGKVLYYTINMNVSDVAVGTYFLRVEYADKSETHKVIISHLDD